MTRMEYENLFSYAFRLSAELDSLCQNNKTDRRNILEFMDANNWFGLDHVYTDKTPHIAVRDLTMIREPLILWLSAYKRPGRDKIALMLEHFKNNYPETCRLYGDFVSDKQMADKPVSWKLLDFLLSEINREITEYDETELKELIGRLDNGATRVAAKLFADFLKTKKQDGEPLSRWTYEFSIRDAPERTTDAYPLMDFAVMAYCVFNEEMWERQGLMEKAVHDKNCADLWLFVALHFICALRASDMVRLPAPALLYDSETILKKISDGTFSKREASALTEDFQLRLKLRPIHPSKTSVHEKVPEIKLFIPESLVIPFGFIMAAALAHRSEIRAGERFILSEAHPHVIRRFFGNEFVKALGDRGFSTRRCNKSYLQGIDVIGGDSPGKPKGYMLAALARSHKSGIGRLAETTDIYLKDARFSGYTPEFIIRQMFERGVFSFIPVTLLKMYAGDSYIKLPVALQTRLIGELGLTAPQVERIAETMEHAMLKSRNAVNIILEKPSDIKINLFNALQNIASGNAPGRQTDCLCLMTAAGLPCAFSDRDGCIGCGYEIYTKTAMHTLMREYAWLSQAKSGSNPAEAKRCSRILEQTILPAVAEMISAVKTLYPGTDVAELLDIVEKGLDYVDCDTGRNKRRLQAVNANQGD